MSDGLFSEVALADPSALPGYRLRRLEVLNWGTFDRRVWTFEIDGRNALLTGDIGSGKSTLVDAITTLLMPSHRISYNKAAGADNRERDLRSYVRGHYKTARDEVHGTSRPVALRDGDTFSVILGVFANQDSRHDVTLAQVFWAREQHAAQPERFFVTAADELSIAKDFADFGTQVNQLKRRLRGSGATVSDRFAEYGRSFRRLLGIASDQAIDLFHQMVSMKAVGDLNDFVRSHMLEPFDAQKHLDQVVAHFDDLSRAHDAVLKAKTQLAELDPLLVDGDRYELMAVKGLELSRRRDRVPGFFAHHKVRLLDERLAELDARLVNIKAQARSADETVNSLRQKREDLSMQRAQLGGDRLGRIDLELEQVARLRAATQAKAESFTARLVEVGLAPVHDHIAFAERLAEIAGADAQVESALVSSQEVLGSLLADQRELTGQIESVRLDLRSLQSRTTSIPRQNLELRQSLCEAFDLDEAELPFAGELIAVRDDGLDWEGAAERLLHGFALSILVHERHYSAVSQWINERHLGKRIVYYRVGERTGSASRPLPGPGTLFGTLQIKDGAHFGWLEDELARRADLDCVDTMQEFRTARRAITREGLIKGGQGRHEKDDRFSIGDRSRYVLGWSNERKIDVTLAEAQRLQKQQTNLTASLREVREADEAMQKRRRGFEALQETTDFADLDWQSHVRHITDLSEEKRDIESASDGLARITSALDAMDTALAGAAKDQQMIVGEQAVVANDHEKCRSDLDGARYVIATLSLSAEEAFEGDLASQLAAYVPQTFEECDRRENAAHRELSAEVETAGREEQKALRAVEAKMAAFRLRFPVDTNELDNSVGSLGEYRQMHARIAEDDLPRFEAEFKNYLNTNTIRDIASFHAELSQQEELIRERIARINDSLVAIDYNEGRYIRLEYAATPNQEIKGFREDLRACTSGAVSGDAAEQYSESKFLEVKKLVERFKGRPDYAELDRRWTRSVTDVRNWLTFSASERWRETDEEHEHYTDSSGKSGGQKEKLAYTILAASLAYQFRLEWGVKKSQNFQFVVIDEAFGRGSDESTRFALGLFSLLGLQLLIVTPLQKIQVIEPYVSTVGLVDNVTGDNSRIQVLTVEEYAERRRSHASRLPRAGDGG